jgi:flagellar basal body rod protein FlgG
MDPAYYVAAGSLKARSYEIETVSNNLANSATVAFKTERTFFSVFNKAIDSDRKLPLSRYVNDGTVLATRGIDFSQGVMKPTGRNLDLAIEGNAFFQIQTPQGVRATRDGRFQLGSGGELQTQDGLAVLGKNGQPMKINPGAEAFTFMPDGTLQQGSTSLGQVDLKAYADTNALQRMGSNRYDATAAAEAPAKAKVSQGYLEQSGADVASLMVDMIRLNRLYEMSMKVASTISNDLDNSTITQVSRSS